VFSLLSIVSLPFVNGRVLRKKCIVSPCSDRNYDRDSGKSHFRSQHNSRSSTSHHNRSRGGYDNYRDTNRDNFWRGDREQRDTGVKRRHEDSEKDSHAEKKTRTYLPIAGNTSVTPVALHTFTSHQPASSTV